MRGLKVIIFVSQAFRHCLFRPCRFPLLDENMHPYTLLTAGALLVVARLLFGLYRTISSPLRSVPGPFLARFTDLWYLWHIYKGDFEHDNLALHRKYGECFCYASLPTKASCCLSLSHLGFGGLAVGLLTHC